MRIPEGAERLAGFMERNLLWIIAVWFIAFTLYRISRFAGFFESFGPATAFSPGLIDVAAFLVAAAAFMVLFRASLKAEGRTSILLLYLAAFAMFAGFTQLSQPGWNDAQGYYDLAALGAEEGPLNMLNNYHTLNTQWPEELKSSIEDDLMRFGLHEWGMEVLKLEVGEPNDYSSRIIKHPPLWPMIMSLFMITFGIGTLSALLAVWAISALVPVSVYYLLKRFVKEKDALMFAFMSAMVPAFLLSGNAPLLDNMTALLVVSSVIFYIRGLDSGDWRMFMVSGAILSLAFYTKFASIFVLAPLLVLSILRMRFRFMVHGILMLVPFVVISLAFMSQNYYFFLTLITAKASVGYVMPMYNTSMASVFALPVYYLNYFGIPLVLMAALYLLRNLTRRPGFPAMVSWMFVLAFTGIMISYPIKIGIERHLLPLVMVLLIPVALQAGNMRPAEKRKFVLISFAVMAVQAILLIP